MGQDAFDSWTLPIAAAGLLVSAIAIVASVWTAARQGKQSAELHRQQVLLSQRQLFLEIWPKLEALNQIDLTQIVVPDVVRTVNVLELVALCWEGGMVDSNVIRRSFGVRYVALHDVVAQVPKMSNPNFSGVELLRQCPAIGKLYDQLRKEQQDHQALKGI